MIHNSVSIFAPDLRVQLFHGTPRLVKLLVRIFFGHTASQYATDSKTVGFQDGIALASFGRQAVLKCSR